MSLPLNQYKLTELQEIAVQSKLGRRKGRTGVGQCSRFSEERQMTSDFASSSAILDFAVAFVSLALRSASVVGPAILTRDTSHVRARLSELNMTTRTGSLAPARRMFARRVRYARFYLLRTVFRTRARARIQRLQNRSCNAAVNRDRALLAQDNALIFHMRPRTGGAPLSRRGDFDST